MTHFFKIMAICSFISILLSGCISDKDFTERVKKVISDNPELVIEAVSKKPKEFVAVLQKSVRDAQANEAKVRREEEAKKLEKYYKEPLKPEIGKYESIRGNKSAPITLVMYSDFQCPFCVKGIQTVKQLMEKYGNKIRYIYKHLPLVSLGHNDAPLAAKYFEAIAMQSTQKAYKFHDELFANQRLVRMGGKYFKKVAKKLKVNMGKLAKDLKSDRVKSKMESDKNEANKFEFRGTPGFLLNGIPIYGAYPYNYFESVISRLKKSGKLSL